ncbi:no significant blast hit [Histoplasma capsulatum var. duboisii H88]|uniref:No significant blast hit n=1 Tax=Ajellomyces capsulatus (strain H88) TaxID=544711 RepID=A0A8A1LEU3_AJEC8|nr:no significant blast hit [Histoplasma capsulatum var. duboisii H88]
MRFDHYTLGSKAFRPLTCERCAMAMTDGPPWIYRGLWDWIHDTPSISLASCFSGPFPLLVLCCSPLLNQSTKQSRNLAGHTFLS